VDDPSDRIEKRAHPRVERRFVLRFRPHHSEDSKWVVSTLSNISQTGCYFYSSILCEIGQLLDVEIQFPVFSEYMHFVGEVKRVDPQEVVRITTCGVGVYFQEMEEEKKKEFLKVLDLSLKQHKDK